MRAAAPRATTDLQVRLIDGRCTKVHVKLGVTLEELRDKMAKHMHAFDSDAFGFFQFAGWLETQRLLSLAIPCYRDSSTSGGS